MVLVLERRLEVIGGKRAELLEQVIEAAVGNGVVAAGRGRHRREADLPEAEFVGEVLIDPADVKCLPRERDSRADGPRAMALQQRLDLRAPPWHNCPARC